MEPKTKKQVYFIEILDQYKPPSEDGNGPESEIEESDLEKELGGVESKTSKKTVYSVIPNFTENYYVKKATKAYEDQILNYLFRRQEALHDFSDRVPGKFVNIFPESVMGSVLGFTYLGENFMGLRDDLSGNFKKMVDIHESIHTPDEYETRVLTDWIMMKEKPRYIR